MLAENADLPEARSGVEPLADFVGIERVQNDFSKPALYGDLDQLIKQQAADAPSSLVAGDVHRQIRNRGVRAAVGEAVEGGPAHGAARFGDDDGVAVVVLVPPDFELFASLWRGFERGDAVLDALVVDVADCVEVVRPKPAGRLSFQALDVS